MRTFLGGLAIVFVVLLGAGGQPVAFAQGDDESRALLLFEADVSAAGDTLQESDEWSFQHISVSGLSETQRLIDDRSDRLAPTVILSVGRNDNADLEAFQDNVEAIVESLDTVERIIWLDLPEQRERDGDSNRVLREVARANPAVRVISWNGAQRSITAYDSATGDLTADGASTMTSLILSELEGRSVGLAAGPLLATTTTETPVPTTTTSTTQAPTTTTTAPPTTTTSTSTSTTEPVPTSSTYLTTTTSTTEVADTSDDTSTEAALAALENADARAASLEQRADEAQPSSTSTADTAAAITTTPAAQDEQAVGVADGEAGGRGLRQAGAFLFTFVVAGFFVAINRNDLEPFEGQSRRTTSGSQ